MLNTKFNKWLKEISIQEYKGRLYQLIAEMQTPEISIQVEG